MQRQACASCARLLVVLLVLACSGPTLADSPPTLQPRRILKQANGTRTLYYDMVITTRRGAPDCYTRDIIVVNGLFQPSIVVQTNDTLVITVSNQLPANFPSTSSGITLHWHGLYMWNAAAWYDGTAYGTMCPIAPGTNFTYRFLVDEASGTYLWHDHATANRANGLQGAFIINNPNVEMPYTQNAGEFVLFLGDWYHDEGNIMAMRLNRPADYRKVTNASGMYESVPAPDSILISGRGRYDDCSPLMSLAQRNVDGVLSPLCDPKQHPIVGSDTDPVTGGCSHNVYTVAAGSTYLFRLINTASSSYLTVCFENHTVTMIAADATPTGIDDYVYPRCIDLNSGQRYDVQLTADANVAPGSTFWISVHSQFRSMSPSAYAVLEYMAPLPSAGRRRSLTQRDTHSAHLHSSRHRALHTSTGPIDLPAGHADGLAHAASGDLMAGSSSGAVAAPVFGRSNRRLAQLLPNNPARHDFEGPGGVLPRASSSIDNEQAAGAGVRQQQQRRGLTHAPVQDQASMRIDPAGSAELANLQGRRRLAQSSYNGDYGNAPLAPPRPPSPAPLPPVPPAPAAMWPASPTPQGALSWTDDDINEVVTHEGVLGYLDNYEYQAYWQQYSHVGGQEYFAGVLYGSPNKTVVVNITNPLMTSSGMLRWAMNNVAMPLNPPCTSVMRDIATSPGWLSKNTLNSSNVKALQHQNDIAAADSNNVDGSTTKHSAPSIIVDGQPAPVIPVVGKHVLTVYMNEVVDIVINNRPGNESNPGSNGGSSSTVQHPMHMHGHKFWVMGVGDGVYDPVKDRQMLNAYNPMLRDTLTLPVGSWALIRFSANNPGLWPFHCHIMWHQFMGQQMYILEAMDLWPKPPSNFPRCTTKCAYNFASYSNTYINRTYGTNSSYQLP